MSADLEQIYLSNLQSPHKHAIVVAYSLSFSLSFSFSLYCTILFIYSSFVRSVSHLVFIPIYLSSHSFIYCLFSSFFFHNIHSHLILSFIHSFIVLLVIRLLRSSFSTLPYSSLILLSPIISGHRPQALK